MITSRHTAIAKCDNCGKIIISSGGGRFERCECGESFIDQESLSGLYTRTSNAQVLEVICPDTCKYRRDKKFKHKGKRINITEELDKYMKRKYNAVWEDDKFIIKDYE